MNETPKREAGFSIVEMLLVVVVVVLIGAVGLYVYNHHHKTTAVSVTTSAATKPVTTSTKPGTTTPSQPAQPSQATTKYLEIKEWGVKSPYTSMDTLTYSIATDNPNLAWLRSQQLSDADQNCTADGNAGFIGRYLPTDNFSLDSSSPQTVQSFLNQDFKASNSQPPAYAKVGKYYYLSGHGPAGCANTSSAVAVENLTLHAVDDMVRHLQAVPR